MTDASPDLPEHRLREFLAPRLADGAVRALVAGLSGGLDSRVLLQAAAQVARELGLPLRAVHVHHGLSPNADAWAEAAAAFCAAEGVPLVVCRVAVAPGASLENAAREARRAAFAGALREGEALLLAQHRDDQAETLLFRLVRGAGLAGLGAMRAETRLALAAGGSVPCWRPFLALSRAQLERHARARGLAWIDDESNADTGLDRNFLRHEILPRLAGRWPAVARTLAETALRLQEAEDLLQELAAELARDRVDARGRLDTAAVLALPLPRQRLLLRYWLRQQGRPLPDAAVLDAICRDVLPAREDAEPRVAWPGAEVRRYRGRLHALAPRAAAPAGWCVPWDGRAPLRLPDGRALVVEGEGGGGPWQVRYRQGGERLRPAPGRPSRELRTWLQEQGVPPWEREWLPLVWAGDELVGVGDLAWPAPRPWRFRLLPPP